MNSVIGQCDIGGQGHSHDSQKSSGVSAEGWLQLQPYTGLPAPAQPCASPLQLGLTLLHFLFPTYKQAISIRIHSTPDSYSPTGKTNDGVKRKKTAWILGGDPRFRELPGGLSVPVTISAP